MTGFPQKKYFRQRAHSNPIADHCFDYPAAPTVMNWSKLYPKYFSPEKPYAEPEKTKMVEFADIGCGYGGLLVTLSAMYPDTLMLGMEIRVKVSDYVVSRINALRSKNPGTYENIACVRSNAMKYLPNYFFKGQDLPKGVLFGRLKKLRKMFFLYPDPHFKKAKHKWRIISPMLLAEYAYCLAVGSILLIFLLKIVWLLVSFKTNILESDTFTVFLEVLKIRCIIYLQLGVQFLENIYCRGNLLSL
ncbi:hypothetical protein J437_LFUL011662 [Ladona fulva]|uniref:tRNA (guanine-N(7)-)-methyltransferase n=1 Tax=Ladona fulva TaxID=123851 RepID=A0A8K0KGC7_LADFU|nr:hypothetical protein J437_LFUL011662 [Ladona fulva]